MENNNKINNNTTTNNIFNDEFNQNNSFNFNFQENTFNFKDNKIKNDNENQNLNYINNYPENTIDISNINFSNNLNAFANKFDLGLPNTDIYNSENLNNPNNNNLNCLNNNSNNPLNINKYYPDYDSFHFCNNNTNSKNNPWVSPNQTFGFNCTDYLNPNNKSKNKNSENSNNPINLNEIDKMINKNINKTSNNKNENDKKEEPTKQNISENIQNISKNNNCNNKDKINKARENNKSIKEKKVDNNKDENSRENKNKDSSFNKNKIIKQNNESKEKIKDDNNNNEDGEDDSDDELSLDDIDKLIENYFYFYKTESKPVKKDIYYNRSFHFCYTDDNNQTNTEILKTELKKGKNIQKLLAVEFFRISKEKRRIYLYAQFKNNPVYIDHSNIPFTKINYYNISADKVENILKVNGEIICDEGESAVKGGNKRNTNNNDNAELNENININENVPPQISKQSIRSININERGNYFINDEGKKKVDVYYIRGNEGCGSYDFVLALLDKLHLPYTNIRYNNNYWLGNFDNISKIAIFDKFIYYNVPYDEFIILISDSIQYLNIKNNGHKNIFNKIFLLGSLKPQEIYKEINNNLFAKNVKTYEYEEIKNKANVEKEFGL